MYQYIIWYVSLCVDNCLVYIKKCIKLVINKNKTLCGMVDVLEHLQSGPFTLKMKAGDSFEMLAPLVELREVTYQKITICIQTAVISADFSSTHSCEIPSC